MKKAILFILALNAYALLAHLTLGCGGSGGSDPVAQADDALAARVALLETELAAVRDDLLAVQIEVVATRLSPEQGEILDHMSIVELQINADGRKAKTIRVSGVNLQVVNGDPQQRTNNILNGLGNLIVGYHEPRTSTVEGVERVFFESERTGSHNLILGQRNDYTSCGGVVSGMNSTVSAPHAAVLAGYRSGASGVCSTVTGGLNNAATADFASVSGGKENRADGECSSVSGGRFNKATAEGASVSGGNANIASGIASSVCSGELNTASGMISWSAGGDRNEAAGDFSWVAGGCDSSVDQRGCN